MIDQIKLKNKTFDKKRCSFCSRTFWHSEPHVNFCGAKECNEQNLDLKSYLGDYKGSIVKLYEQYCLFLKEKDPLYLRRPKTIVKNSFSKMAFLCAGISALQKLTDPFYKNQALLEQLDKRPVIYNPFCFRFLDQQNVGSTKRHATGFFMLSLACFETQKKRFKLTWRTDWLIEILLFFNQVLGIPLKNIYLHLDSWSDGVLSGLSVEIFINGIEIGNLVFTDSFVSKREKLANAFLDIGIGLERLHELISNKKNPYFLDFRLDHLRTFAYATKDGIYPSKLGVGYNIRKIIEAYFKRVKHSCQEKFFKTTKVVLGKIIGSAFKNTKEAGFNQKLLQLCLKILKAEYNRCTANYLL